MATLNNQMVGTWFLSFHPGRATRQVSQHAGERQHGSRGPALGFPLRCREAHGRLVCTGRKMTPESFRFWFRMSALDPGIKTWLVVWNMFYFSIGNFIIPTDLN
jgi:hypothetical protein